MQLGNQIGQRYVHKAAGRHGQEVRQKVLQLPHQEVTHRPAQRGHGPGQRHLQQRHATVGAALAQHHQIAHVVRHLVRHHRHGGNHPQAHVGHEGRCDQNAVAKAMHAVTREQRPAARAWAVVVVRVAVVMPMVMAVVVLMRGRLCMAVFVPVVPQLGLVQQKEEHHPHQQGGEQVVRARLAFKRLGQQVHEGRGQQGPCGQAEQVLRAHAIVAPAQAQTHQQCCSPHAAYARSQRGDQDCYQCHSY